MSYPVRKTPTHPVHEAALVEAEAVLSQGGVVALPSETVYLLASRAKRPDAVARVRALSGRNEPFDAPYLLADREDVATYVNGLPVRAARLVRRHWPGPLTLVLGDGADVALRLPDHPVLREILRRVSAPIVGSDLFRAGEKPATTARRVLRYAPEGLDLLVDAGKCRLGTEPSVVRFDATGAATILVPGHFGEEALRAALAVNLVLVCTGNTCRSPMAAAALRAALSDRLHADPGRLERAGFSVRSAGLAAFPGARMTHEASLALTRADIPFGEHAATPLGPELVDEADLLLVMTRAHRAALLSRHPGAASRTVVLDPNGEDVEDPIGGPLSSYEACLAQLRSAISARLEGLLALGAPR